MLVTYKALERIRKTFLQFMGMYSKRLTLCYKELTTNELCCLSLTVMKVEVIAQVLVLF